MAAKNDGRLQEKRYIADVDKVSRKVHKEKAQRPQSNYLTLRFLRFFFPLREILFR